MSPRPDDLNLLSFIVARVNVGIFVVDQQMNVVLWNRFMEVHSGRPAAEVDGSNLFDGFPELPRNWLEKKIKSVFLLKNFAFTSWEQRPYLFRFQDNRPVTGGVDAMRQNCTFLPVNDGQGDMQYVCITLFDVTDTSVYQTKLQEAMTSLEEVSQRDGLTGVYNRRHLEHHLSHEFNCWRRYGGELSFLMFDIDHFKKVNDVYGHLAGDEVLREVAANIKLEAALLRTTDIAGRYGGEEFGIILPGTPLEGAAIVAERLRTMVAAAPVRIRDVEIPVTISLGVAQADTSMPDYERLIHDADKALYASKAQGRNRVTCFTSPQRDTLG
jgi:diguanylate cyclase (GGDEF)-like protein